MFGACQVALYNLVARVRFAEQRRASMRRPKRVCCDLLLRISVATVIGMAMKTALDASQGPYLSAPAASQDA